jgi:hypothetical protein
MAIIHGARVVLKENGRERWRKLLGENDNAQRREKSLSRGVSGVDILWVPSCKLSRRWVWHKVRCAARTTVNQEEPVCCIWKEDVSLASGSLFPEVLFDLNGSIIPKGRPLSEVKAPWVFINCDGNCFVPETFPRNQKSVSGRKVSEAERRLLAIPDYCWKSVGPRRRHCQCW